jgi:hypothetical protein
MEAEVRKSKKGRKRLFEKDKLIKIVLSLIIYSKKEFLAKIYREILLFSLCLAQRAEQWYYLGAWNCIKGEHHGASTCISGGASDSRRLGLSSGNRG